MSNKIRTSEWVSLGHPDKTADYISEYILDRLLEIDPNVRYALECQIKGNYVSLVGEVTTRVNNWENNIGGWVREAVNKIGYTKEYQKKFGADCTIKGENVVPYSCITTQSPDIALGVDNKGWGDQGIFFGAWWSETENGYTKEYSLAKKIGTKLYEKALSPKQPYGIDIKTQVTYDVDEDKITKVVVAIPTVEGKRDHKQVQKEISTLIKKAFPETVGAKFIINGTGEYHIHGPIGDSGTTGRKLVVDLYGSGSRIGGGCVDAQTEYMSETGWKRISEYDGGKVGQLSDSLELQIVDPEQYIETFHEDVYEVSTENTTNMVLSSNHNVLYRTSKGHLQKKELSKIIKESEDSKKGSHIDIPMTFTYDFANGNVCKYNEDWIRIVVAHCADGTVLKKGGKTWNCRIRVKKQYKIDRLRKLFSKYPDMYEERKYSDGYTYFYYHLEDTSKLLCEQFFNPDNKTAQMLSEEVYKWDGSEKYKEYRTTKKQDADFMQFVLSGINGNAYSICTKKKKDGYSDVYTVRETKKKHSSPFRKIGKNKIEKKNPQKMYCFTVPSGKLLLRRNGYIFCTGNSPWTKDGTKADLTLNILAREVSKEAYFMWKDIMANLGHIETELSCCIGKQDVDVIITAYDKRGDVVYRMAEERKIPTDLLIDRYGLRKPKYAELCKRGLFWETLEG